MRDTHRAVLYNSLGGALKLPVRRSRSQAEPWQPRGESPGGCLNPRARKGESTFGNTAKRRHLSQKPNASNDTHSKKAPVFRLVLFLLNQQLPILPGRFQPSTFGVCELNYRVRHGYGCILTAIATESLRVCTLKTV